MEASTIRAISLFGLGKLGAPFAAALAHKGYHVIGVDVDPNKIRSINEGKAPVYEPGLQELLSLNKERLTATNDYEFAIRNSDITFIVVPTPSDEQGGFLLRYVLAACEVIGAALRRKSVFHLVVLTSTVLPGATEGEVKPSLERHSGKRCGVDFGLCYSPEFIALGSVIRDFLNPDFILIGQSDPHSGEILTKIYKRVCENDPPIARMNFVNAELTKLAVNTFVTTKISFANMLARICERLPGAHVDVVTSALGLDSRIGPKYLQGAIGYGGPCFPRDNIAFTALARQIGAPATLAEATDCFNREEIHRLTTLVKDKLTPSGTVGILGLSYKPNTDVVEEAQGLLLAQRLLQEGIPVAVHDPAAMENARRTLSGLGDVRFASSPEECIRQADVAVLTVPWNHFRHLEPSHLGRRSLPRVLIDCWRLLEKQGFEDTVEYIPLGRGREPAVR